MNKKKGESKSNLVAIILAAVIIIGGAAVVSAIFLLKVKDLEESEIALFVQESFGNFDRSIGYTMTGKDENATIEAYFDGTNKYMKVTEDGEESLELYFITHEEIADMFSYTMMSDLGPKLMWVKYPMTVENENKIKTLVDEFVNKQFLIEEIENEFTYVGMEDCTKDIGGTCYKFEVHDITMYFDAKAKRVVQVTSEDMDVVFDYDGKITITVPEEAKSAKTALELQLAQAKVIRSQYGADMPGEAECEADQE